MFRRHQNQRLRGSSSSLQKKRGRKDRFLSRRQYWIERLEVRHMLTGTPLGVGFAAPPDPADLALAQVQAAAVNSVSLMPVAPFALEQTFLLHSNPTATKTIYLDFDGFITRNTQWNTDYGQPNIVTPAFSRDTDYNNFSDTERGLIQLMWEQVSEDFRPFDVDVTTQDPGEENLINTGFDINTGLDDEQWGTRVVIGGSDLDWQRPVTNHPSGGIAYLSSFNDGVDQPAFVFGADFASIRNISEAISHEAGHTLGLNHDGLIWFWQDSADMSFHEAGEEYYPGHPRYNPLDLHIPTPAEWAPIMGVSYGKPLSQWSFGQYPGANNIEDDLAIITGANGFGYRVDDHSDIQAGATALDLDPATVDTEINTYFGEGIIGEHPSAGVSDVDYFSFTVEGLGEILSFDISPFQTSPNLDILAKLYNSSGGLIATSNPIEDLAAGGQTISTWVDGGWLNSSGQYVTEFTLLPGTYYLSVEGTGKQLTFLDPAYHPVIVDPAGAPDAPKLPFDHTDWGYSNYGSLGYYSITGTRKKGLVVGVDFDVDGGAVPTNWNLYTGGTGPEDTVKNLISEAGLQVPYQLTVSTSGTSINTFESDNGVDPLAVPTHVNPLDDLDGFISAEDETLTFTWSNLAASTVYQIYVFGHADFNATNVVTVTGGLWNGVQQTFNFAQDITADSLNVNENLPGQQELSTLSLIVISDENGQINIEVNNPVDSETGVAGLAIAPTKVGSISGTKWNDENGDQVFNGNEDGLEGWTIYLDLNNNGQLDSTASPTQTFTKASTDIPQTIPDQNIVGVKSALTFTDEEQGIIEDVNVTLDITHTYDADIHAVLISPTGTRVKLFAHVGSSGDNFHNTVLDDSAALLITDPNEHAPFTASYRPEEPLSVLVGENALGTWNLELIDDSVGDVGVLNSWSLTIKMQGVTTFLEPVQVTDVDGDYTFDALQPGLYNVREFISPDQVAAGWHQTWAPAPFTLRSGSNLQNVDFGNWIPIDQSGSIQGQKYYDSNQNGVRDDEDPGLPGWIVYIDSNNNGVRDIATAPTVTQSTDVPKAITDFDTTTSQVIVDTLGTVFNIEVTLDITHSFIDDLDVYLVSPSGRSVELFTGVGGQYNDIHNLTLSDNATRDIASIGFNDLPYSGTWKPEGLLSDFGGEDAAGIWTLVVTDTTSADEGTLNSWSLSVTSGEVFRTTGDDGSYSFASLAPGAYTVREEAKPGWVQIPPTTTGIPGATWTGTGWDVVVDANDDFNLPVPDSHRNVKNVDFGNYAPAGSISGVVYRDLDANATKAATEPGLPGWTVFVDSNTNGILDTDTVNATVSSDTAESINNFFTVSSKVWFGSMTSVSDVDVTLDISHTYDADMSVYLISPSGTRVKLFANAGSSGDNFEGTSFDDSALQTIDLGSAPFAGTFKPAEPLSIFNGENATGYWTLEIKDSALGDDGTLNGWSLSIKGDELSAVTDAEGHYSFANLPPNVYHLDTVQIPDWTRTEAAGAVTLLPSQTVLTANFGERPPYLPGDFNSDGLVDSADFLVWRRQSGTTVPNFSGADGDGDGDVDQADLALWRQNFGKYRDDHGNDALLATNAVLPAAVGGKIEVPGDVDWFSFNATAGTPYRFKATLGTLDAGNLQIFGTNGTTQLATNSSPTPLIEWTAPADGFYYAQVQGLNVSSAGTYTLDLSEVVIDDYGNDAASSALLSVPGSLGGEIEIANDVDWFNFTATVGNSYNISVQLGTLPYATLRVIGTDGTSQLLSSGGFGPSVHWTPPSSGTYYLEAGGQTTTGTYVVSIAIDDYGNTSGTATPIAVPSTTAGNIEAPGDVDFFSFVATSGTSYRFRTTLLSLPDSEISLFAPDGTTELAYDDDGGGGLSSLIDWTAPSSGTYFVQVGGFGSASGTYSLAASINGPGSGSSTLLASAAAGLMMESDSAPLATTEQPVSSTGDSLSLASFAIASQGTASGSARNSTKLAPQARSESGAQNDLALLAWLASSAEGNHSGAGESLADDDLSASRLSDEPESVDVAFELLEGNALASATI